MSLSPPPTLRQAAVWGAAGILGLLIAIAAVTGWPIGLGSVGLPGAFAIGLIVGIPLGRWLVLRRRREQKQIVRHLSESRAREAELREASELARAADAAKGQFLATMSHEVRTPLNGIVGFSSLLSETPLNAEQREYLQSIRISADTLMQLTGDILDYTRIESGGLKLDPSSCDPRDCVEDALDLLAAKAAAKGLELLHRTVGPVPAGVMVDGGRLRQVLINLVGNAVKFTERGQVEVTLTCTAEPPAAAAGPTATGESCALRFSVRDTGIGIAPEHHAKLFHAFSQVDESMTRRYGGAGLGLAISRNLVRRMGGEIDFESRPGEGSTFSFTIRVPVVASALAPHDLGRKRVLLVQPAGPVRSEHARLLGEWNAVVEEIESVERLPEEGWAAALVEVSAVLAEEFPDRARPPRGWRPEAMVGLVSVALSTEQRAVLRRHFRVLINQPVHHEALFSLLRGAIAREPAPAAAQHFGFHVLVVEDNPVNQRLAQRMLEVLGCRSLLAANGREALAVLSARGEEFDLVLLDLHMPEMDGLSALRALRSGEAGLQAQGIPIIALSGEAREQPRREAREAGLHGYLAKPLKLAELEGELQRLREARGGRPS